MFSARSLARVFVLAMPLLLVGASFGYVIDDDVPDVTGRVARISYIVGEAQIRRLNATEWEKAVLNLPLVEGDEIATSAGARLEIQFDSRTFLRVQENSVLKFTTLKDEGVAVSLPEGAVSLRLTDFDKDRTFFEIDIPNTTIAVQRSGLYRIDTGGQGSSTASIRVTDDGEARIYSDTSGFTLRNGRMATVFLAGQNAGEWDTSDATALTDDFDTWTLDRDSVIAKRLRDSYYDKYYDRDIYGAEDLSDHGEWVYTRKYGYVWRPFRTSIVGYSDWSPYRYGHWRWVPPFGWTWVNDEPWGWVTYHYGRWVWDNGYWYWTPYGYYRYRRSWWQPALVVIRIINNNICWYPLPYHYRYYNYNWNYYGRNYGGRRNNSGGGGNGPGTTPSPVPTSTPAGPTQAQINESRRQRMHTPTLSTVPPGGVVTVSAEEFGKGRGGIRRASPDVAKTVISKAPDEVETPPILPPFEQVNAKITKEIRAESPPIIQTDLPARTGAAERKSDKPLDEELRKSRIFGNRTPTFTPRTQPTETRTLVPAADQPRNTGAVDRPVVKQRNETPVDQTPPIFVPPANERKVEPPRREEPKYEPPKREEPRYETPRRNDVPKYEPPPRTEPPKYEPPPRREEPRSEPPKRSEPPPQKTEPRPQKPSEDSGGKKKDG